MIVTSLGVNQDLDYGVRDRRFRRGGYGRHLVRNEFCLLVPVTRWVDYGNHMHMPYNYAYLIPR